MSESSSRLLIVNADDYGLTKMSARGILRAHAHGVVTSVSVTAVGPAFEQAAAWLGDWRDIGVGGHLTAVGEDPPLLTAREIPSLVDKDGFLPFSWREFLVLWATRRIKPRDMEREFTAQIERLLAAGLTLTHLDTHQHLHLLPGVGQVVARLAVRHGIPAVRVPRSHARRPRGWGVRILARKLEARLAREGLVFPAAAAGLDEAGRLDLTEFVRAVGQLAREGAPSAEINCHPGVEPDPEHERYLWGFHWGDELDALLSHHLKRKVDRLGFRLGTYADLPGTAISRP